MKKNSYLLIFLVILLSIIFLSNKSYRYVGVNYAVEYVEITNFQKLSEFYKRHINYKKLAEKITYNSKNKREEILNISTWVYKNIKKASKEDTIIDNHPWTIVERKIGAADQFSDILSVLLVHNNINSFFIRKFSKIVHPITFFKYDNEWSIIDPYYGIYFTSNKSSFSTIKENKNGNLDMMHLTLGKVNIKNLDKIFFDKNFKNIYELDNYFRNLISKIPSSRVIENTNIYKRGGRSYIQKPLHRIFVQIRRFLKI
jgi:hypothetical protein